MGTTMDRVFVECSALGFQTVLTILLALAYLWLWRRQRRPYFLTWSLAWTLYAARLAFMSAFLVERQIVWLFAHQVVHRPRRAAAAAGRGAVLAGRGVAPALPVARGRWRWPGPTSPSTASAAWRSPAPRRPLLLFAVTLWTAIVFWRYQRATRSGSALILAWSFLLWALHHLDYPLLRSFGTATFYTVFVDVLIIVAVTIGTLFLVLGEERRKLATRTTQLEQLTRLLLRAQEDERRRIARELHDEAGQVLTAVKIELDLDGRKEASEMVARALAQVRDLSNLLRPSVLDDLGLLPALRAMAEDFARRTHIDVALSIGEGLRGFTPEQEVVIYRVVQEALTNVARHAGARQVRVELQAGDRAAAPHDRGRRPRGGGRADAAARPARHARARHRPRRYTGDRRVARAGLPARSPHPDRSHAVSDAVRILLADDHTLVRAGVRRILEAQPGLTVAGEVSDGDAALDFLRANPVDVLVLDLTMPGTDGFEVLRQVKATLPGMKVLVLTMHADAEYVARAVQDGADGYLLKDSAVQDLVAAIEAVQAGRAYYSPPVQRELSELLRAHSAPPRPMDTLTDREREVLRLVVKGLSTKEIASQLDISTRTVETHRANLMRKLNLKSVALLTQFAIREGLVQKP